MATWIHFLLFCNFALFVLSDQAEQILPTVQIINSLAPKSPPVTFRYDSKNIVYSGDHYLSVGEVYEFKVEHEDPYYCIAEWQQYFARWNGFELRRDKNHEFVYWLLKKDGLYRSWDKANWVLESPWETD